MYYTLGISRIILRLSLRNPPCPNFCAFISCKILTLWIHVDIPILLLWRQEAGYIYAYFPISSHHGWPNSNGKNTCNKMPEQGLKLNSVIDMNLDSIITVLMYYWRNCHTVSDWWVASV